MRMLAIIAFFGIGSLGLWPSRAFGAAVDPTRVQFVLVTPPSGLETGCFGPCECPVETRPTYGSFVLSRTGADPLYTYYDVSDYIASFNNGPGAVALMGSGHYRIGGEVALVQQLTMDLQLTGGPLVHFDSGLVPVSRAFPEISVSAPAHAFACIDTVLHVDANPAALASVPPHAFAGGIVNAWPNPFRGRVNLALDPARSDPIEATVLDLAGRRVRALVVGSAASGLIWDGSREGGGPAPPGVYRVRVRWSDGESSRSIILLP